MGLIVAVLLFDLGLAAAGGVLLAKGLASARDKTEQKSETKTDPAPVEKKSELDTPAPTTAAPTNAAPGSTSAQVARATSETPPTAKPIDTQPASATKPTAKSTAAAREGRKSDKPENPLVRYQRPDEPALKPTGSDATKPDATKPDATAKPVDVVPTAPQDPYVAPNTEREVDAAAAHSKAAFDRCASAGDAHGTIKIAFQVRHDGRVINAAPVENSTGNTDLARCLVAEISTWNVSAHNGTSINMVRPFTYP